MPQRGQQRGSLFVPIHWSDATASSARIGDLVAPCTDPYSGQPEAKATPAAIAPVAFAYRGFALSRAPLPLPDEAPGGRVSRVDGAQGCLFASNDGPMAWHELAPRLFEDAVLTEYVDRARGLYRAAAFVDGRLDGALFIGPADTPPQWSDLRSMAGGPAIAGERAGDLRLLRRRTCRHPSRRSPRARPSASRRSALRCAPAPIAEPACRN